MFEYSSKLLLLAFVYLILFTLEYLIPYFNIRQHHLQHSIRNLSLALINSLTAVCLLVFILIHVFDWTTRNNFGLLNILNLDQFASYIIAFILLDLWQYIWHRLNHKVVFLWRFHQVHHADKDMDASTGVRFHTVEIIFSSLTRILIIPILGLELNQLILYEVILLPIILFHHSNINLNENLDRILRIFIVTPHIHRLHHSDIKSETNSNYSSVFSIWDRIFSSYSMRSIESGFRLGLGKQFSSNEWNRLWGMIKMPFQKVPKYTPP
ncbi:MAG: sterol desaturase family protein [Pseudomonadota bacterium]